MPVVAGLAAAAVVTGAIGASKQASAAKKAGNAQAAAAQKASALDKYIFDTQREDLAPYRESGYDALDEYRAMMGFGYTQSDPRSVPGLSEYMRLLPGEGKDAAGEKKVDYYKSLFDDRSGQMLSSEEYIKTLPSYAKALTTPTKVLQNGKYVNVKPTEQQVLADLVSGKTVKGFSAADAAKLKQYNEINKFYSALPPEQVATKPSVTDPMQKVMQTPGYQFRMDEGQKALERSAAARGGLNSGATLKALQRYGQDYSSNEYGNYMNRLAGLAGIQSGNQALPLGMNAAQNYGKAAGEHISDYGAAKASGYMGQGAAMGGFFNNTSNMFGSMAGGMAGGGMMSDSRLKTDIKYVGRENGHRIYQFKYATDPDATYEGVLAQDVLMIDPEAISQAPDGMMAVHYDRIGLKMRRVA